MAAIVKQALLFTIIAACSVGIVVARECRSGYESPYLYFYYEKHPCFANQSACFQSVTCDYTSYFGKSVNFRWECFNAANCKNTTKGSFATYLGRKGKCCFTDNCNAYKANCTVTIKSGTSKMMPGYLLYLFGISLAMIHFLSSN